MSAYQTFLPACKCGRRNGILFKDNVACCGWCRTPYAKAAMINYEDEHSPKPEQPKEFQWTDELVVDFNYWTNVEAPTFQGRYADIEQFKEMVQSKSSHPSTEPMKEDKERISVIQFYFECSSTYGKDYVVTTNKSIPGEKFRLIKLAIEYVLNSDDKTYQDFLINGHDRKFSQTQLDNAIQKAFNAARTIVHSGSGTEKQLEKALQASIESMGAFKDAADYKQSLTNQK